MRLPRKMFDRLFPAVRDSDRCCNRAVMFHSLSRLQDKKTPDFVAGRESSQSQIETVFVLRTFQFEKSLRLPNGLRLSGRAFQRSAPAACWAALSAEARPSDSWTCCLPPVSETRRCTRVL